MIRTSGELLKELARLGDDAIIIKLDEMEFVIDSIGHSIVYGDMNMTCLCLNIRDGGQGCVKR